MHWIQSNNWKNWQEKEVAYFLVVATSSISHGMMKCRETDLKTFGDYQGLLLERKRRWNI